MSGTLRFQQVIVLTAISEYFGCHLRVWENGERTIVVAGQFKKLFVPESRIEECVDEIARLYLADARPFEFYVYDPGTVDKFSAEDGKPFREITFDVDDQRRRGTALVARISNVAGYPPAVSRTEGTAWCAFSNPQWGRHLAPGEFLDRAGVDAEEFPADLYTPEAVRAYLESGVTQVPWDPYHLKQLLTEVSSLDTIIRATDDERIREVLTVAASLVSSDTGLIRLHYADDQERNEPAIGPLVKEYPKLSDDDWLLLDDYRAKRKVPVTEDYEGLATIRELLHDIGIAGRHPVIDGVALEALERAERIVGGWLRIADEDFRNRERDRDRPPYRVSNVIYVLGEADRSYLETIRWTQQPRDGDERRHAELLARLGASATETDALAIRLGYDPFDRMLIISANYYGSEVYVVEWPQILSERGYPDSAYIVADDNHLANRGGRPAYVEYADGTYDLLPIDPDRLSSVPGFKWGYGGEGPSNLERAIKRACCSDISPPGRESPFGWLDSMISFPPALERLKLQVGEIRRWHQGEQSPEEEAAWRAGRGGKYLAEYFGLPYEPPTTE
jgi:hypothetical protein